MLLCVFQNGFNDVLYLMNQTPVVHVLIYLIKRPWSRKHLMLNVNSLSKPTLSSVLLLSLYTRFYPFRAITISLHFIKDLSLSVHHIISEHALPCPQNHCVNPSIYLVMNLMYNEMKNIYNK